MKILVELEFDEKDLGPKWMNIDNLYLLLYSTCKTKKKLLQVTNFEEITDHDSENCKAVIDGSICDYCKLL